MLNLQLSHKQQVALELLDDPTLVELGFGGGAGGGKSMVTGLWEVIECHKYPGIGIGLGRKELVRLEQTSLQTILTEVHPMLGIRDIDFAYNGRLHTLTYRNGSQIILVDMAYQPKDPNYERFGSLNLTHVVIEEAGELEQKAINAMTSRKNRRLNKQYGIIGKTVLTFNPSQNFLRTEWYDPYDKLGGGDYQKWPHGTVELFDKTEVTAYRAFVKSLPTDNPFLPRNYLLTLISLPPEERKRLLEGDWDYETSEKALIVVRVLDRSIRPPVPPKKDKEGLDKPWPKFAAADVAREGKDKTVFGLVEGRQLIDLFVPNIIVADKAPILMQVAKEFMTYCQKHGVGFENACLDAVGLGAGVYDKLLELGFELFAFKAGAKSDQLYDDGSPKYKNLRSEAYWQWTQGLEDGKATIYEKLPHLDTLRQDVLVHNKTITDKMIVVESKDELKKRLGRSPDFSDAASMADWLAVYKTRSNLNFFFEGDEADKPEVVDEFYSPEIERADAEDEGDDDSFL